MLYLSGVHYCDWFALYLGPSWVNMILQVDQSQLNKGSWKLHLAVRAAGRSRPMVIQSAANNLSHSIKQHHVETLPLECWLDPPPPPPKKEKKDGWANNTVKYWDGFYDVLYQHGTKLHRELLQFWENSDCLQQCEALGTNHNAATWSHGLCNAWCPLKFTSSVHFEA